MFFSGLVIEEASVKKNINLYIKPIAYQLTESYVGGVN